MPVYADADQANMMYAVLAADHKPRQTAEDVKVDYEGGRQPLINRWMLQDLEFRFKMIAEAAASVERLYTDGVPHDAINAEAYREGYIRQCMLQIQLDLENARRSASRLLID